MKQPEKPKPSPMERALADICKMKGILLNHPLNDEQEQFVKGIRVGWRLAMNSRTPKKTPSSKS